jgi:hypothetical protein
MFSFPLPDPWKEIVDADQRLALEAELRKELGSCHALYGVSAKALAYRIDCDDVLFELTAQTTFYAVVHLAWSGRRENDSRWPEYRCYESLDLWRSGLSLLDLDD